MKVIVEVRHIDNEYPHSAIKQFVKTTDCPLVRAIKEQCPQLDVHAVNTLSIVTNDNQWFYIAGGFSWGDVKRILKTGISHVVEIITEQK